MNSLPQLLKSIRYFFAAPILFNCTLINAADALPRINKISILAVGNSITVHAPSQSLDWLGNWGMAASALDKDYVSQLDLLLNTTGSSNPRRINLSNIERAMTNTEISLEGKNLSDQFDLLVIELGDNVKKDKESIANFSIAYESVIGVSKKKKRYIRCLSTWWNHQEINNIIEKTCVKHGGLYVYISDLSKQNQFLAKNERDFKNAGVGSHPGDRGMKAIAERIFITIQRK